MKQRSTLSYQGIFIIALSSLFYLYEFFLRVSPTVITTELMQHFSIDALYLSFITTAFYIGYTPMQIPAGSMCNHLNLRYVMASAMGLASIACYCFGITESYYIAILWRIILGVLSAFAFVGPLMLTRRWLPNRYFALTTGLIQFSGCLGALIGLHPFTVANQIYGWQTTLTYTAIIGLILACLFACFIRSNPTGHQLSENSNTSFDTSILRSKQLWLIAIIAFASWAPLAVLGELWGVRVLEVKWEAIGIKAELMMNYFWLAVALASPIIGWLSDRIQSRTKLLKICFLMSFIGIISLLLLPPNIYLESCSLVLIGASVAAQTLTFAMVNDRMSPDKVGFAYGFNNVAVICSGIILPPISGLIMRYTWDGTLINEVPYYSLHDFQQGLIILPMISIAGLWVSSLVEETYRCD